jgi:hypothetical protein
MGPNSGTHVKNGLNIYYISELSRESRPRRRCDIVTGYVVYMGTPDGDTSTLHHTQLTQVIWGRYLLISLLNSLGVHAAKHTLSYGAGWQLLLGYKSESLGVDPYS